jgi:hypothetical protein
VAGERLTAIALCREGAFVYYGKSTFLREFAEDRLCDKSTIVATAIARLAKRPSIVAVKDIEKDANCDYSKIPKRDLFMWCMLGEYAEIA